MTPAARVVRPRLRSRWRVGGRAGRRGGRAGRHRVRQRAALAIGPFGLGTRAAAVALAPDGRIVVAGDQRGAGGEGALTGRVGSAGAADPSFAGNGARIDTFGTGAAPQRAGAVAVQADGSVSSPGSPATSGRSRDSCRPA